MTVPPLRELVHTMLLTVQEADAIRDLRAGAGYVIVHCPPGSRVVVSRESKPCETCNGDGWGSGVRDRKAHECHVCDGSGVVEETTTYGLESLGWFPPKLGSEPVDQEVFRLVALPEETP